MAPNQRSESKSALKCSSKLSRKRRGTSILTYRQADALCREFIPIGDQVFSIIDKLQQCKFGAFAPGLEFLTSFCQDESARDAYRRYTVERAKNLLGRPWPLELRNDIYPDFFSSTYIRQLCVERDKRNGVTVAELSKRYPGEIWRLEIDSCQRQRVLASVNDRDRYNALWEDVLDQERQELSIETDLHATPLSRAFSFDGAQRYRFFLAAMERDLEPLGFANDRAKSRTNFPVFTRQISKTWDFCWSLADPKALVRAPSEGFFRPSLEVRHRQLGGSLEKAELGNFLIIRYQDIVPNFGRTYMRFSSLSELETIIRAHLCLYALIEASLDKGLRAHLQE